MLASSYTTAMTTKVNAAATYLFNILSGHTKQLRTHVQSKYFTDHPPFSIELQISGHVAFCHYYPEAVGSALSLDLTPRDWCRAEAMLYIGYDSESAKERVQNLMLEFTKYMVDVNTPIVRTPTGQSFMLSINEVDILIGLMPLKAIDPLDLHGRTVTYVDKKELLAHYEHHYPHLKNAIYYMKTDPGPYLENFIDMYFK